MPIYRSLLYGDFLYSTSPTLEGPRGAYIDFTVICKVSVTCKHYGADTATWSAFEALINQVGTLGGNAATELEINSHSAKGSLHEWTVKITALAVKAKRRH